MMCASCSKVIVMLLPTLLAFYNRFVHYCCSKSLYFFIYPSSLFTSLLSSYLFAKWQVSVGTRKKYRCPELNKSYKYVYLPVAGKLVPLCVVFIILLCSSLSSRRSCVYLLILLFLFTCYFSGFLFTDSLSPMYFIYFHLELLF